MVSRLCLGLVLLLVGLALGGCRSNPPAAPASDRLLIMVSIPPQQYFVERIGDRHVTVRVMVPPGAEPHTFEPKPEQLKVLSQAKAYLRIRIEFEDVWMPKLIAANPRMLVVDTTQGVQRLPLDNSSPLSGNTPQSGAHLDPHIWLSPKLVQVQARTIYEALVTLDRAHQAEYQANLNRFLADLDQLDATIRSNLKGAKNRKFIVMHPGWGYFARDYQLEQVAIAVGGQEPSAAELAQLITTAKQAHIKVVFAEPQFSQQSATAIAQEIGGRVLLIDPLSPDWMTNLQTVSTTFASVMSQRYPFHPVVAGYVPNNVPAAARSPRL